MVALDWTRVAEMLPAERQQALLAELDLVMASPLESDEEDRRLRQFPEPLRALWLVNWLDYEVAQGSLLAYFYNSHGRFADETTDLLRRIGADEMADVMEQASATIEPAPDESADGADRQQEYSTRLGHSSSPGADQMDSFTDRYWIAAENDGWGDKLDAYIAAQVEALADA